MAMEYVNNSFLTLNESNSSNFLLSSVSSSTIDMAYYLQNMTAIVLNSLVMITIIYFSDLRKSIKSQYFIHHTALHIILVLVIWAYRRTPTLGWIYCRDTLVIILCITYMVEMHCYYQEVKAPQEFADIALKDVITVVMILVWPPPFLLICIALISQVSLYTWTLVFMCIISIGVIILGVVNIKIYLLAKTVVKENDDDVCIDDIDVNVTEFTNRHHIVSVLFLFVISLKMTYSYLILARVYPYDLHVDTTLYQIIVFQSIVEPLLYIFLSRDMREVFKKVTRYLNSEQRALDRKKTKNLLMRERFSGSI